MILKPKTACFSGYRPEKFPYPLDSDNQKYMALCRRISRAVELAVDHGYGTFLCGMARGFDLVAGEQVLELKEKRIGFDRVKLIAVLPYQHHNFSGCVWGDIHQRILSRAHETVTLSPNYYSRAFHDRNKYMVERSGRIICYYDGQSGGTAHTVGLAEDKGLEIVNLFEPTNTYNGSL